MIEDGGIIAAILVVIFGYVKLVVLPRKKIKRMGEKLEEAKNDTVGKEKELRIAEAQNDYDNAVSSSTDAWVSKWLKRSRPK